MWQRTALARASLPCHPNLRRFHMRKLVPHFSPQAEMKGHCLWCSSPNTSWYCLHLCPASGLQSLGMRLLWHKEAAAEDPASLQTWLWCPNWTFENSLTSFISLILVLRLFQLSLNMLCCPTHLLSPRLHGRDRNSQNVLLYSMIFKNLYNEPHIKVLIIQMFNVKELNLDLVTF